jgi:hypothetical protein
LKTPQLYGVSKLIFVQPLLKLKKEALDIADQPQALTPGGDRNIHTSNVIATLPLSQ